MALTVEQRAYQKAYWARPEMQGYQARRRSERRAEFFANKRCVDCGAAEDLELDHIDRVNKIDSDVWLWSEAKKQAEIAKCVIRCGSCHRERHARETRRHGISAYNSCGCRCDVCCAAKEAAKARRTELRRLRKEESRRRPESNRDTQSCSLLRNRSATPPEDAEPYRQLSSEGLAA